MLADERDSWLRSVSRVNPVRRHAVPAIMDPRVDSSVTLGLHGECIQLSSVLVRSAPLTCCTWCGQLTTRYNDGHVAASLLLYTSTDFLTLLCLSVTILQSGRYKLIRHCWPLVALHQGASYLDKCDITLNIGRLSKIDSCIEILFRTTILLVHLDFRIYLRAFLRLMLRQICLKRDKRFSLRRGIFNAVTVRPMCRDNWV